ncbi:UNVERIFIED_CONTAM: hypothetical protein FKN15_013472 [Acipenser sinensis]
MSKDTFELLCHHLHSKLHKSDTRFRSALSVKLKVFVTLWRLATNCEFRTIGHLFGKAKSTACASTREICEATVEVLLPI